MAEVIKSKLIYAFDDKRYIYLLTRIDGKKHIDVIEDFQWYFCVSTSDFKKIPEEMLRSYLKIGVLIRSENIGNYVKLYSIRSHQLFNDFITKLKREGVACLEMDLSLTKRYMIDNQVDLEEDLKIGFYDIETDDSIGKIEVGRDQILSWAIVDENHKYYASGEDEKELLLKFLNAMDKFDVIVGWNSSNFDLPYLKARCEYHGLQYKTRDGVDIWKRTMQIDLMMRYVKLFAPIMSILNLTSFSLNEMSKVFLNRQKIDHSEKIIELFNDNPEKLKEYNINDCMLVMELNKKMNTLPLMIKECVWTGSFMDKFYVGELLDNYILRESKKAGIYLTSRPNTQEEEINRRYSITGGYVMEPKTGFYSNLRVFDFKSLYPTVMIGHNLGDDTLVKELAITADSRFKRWLTNKEVKEREIEKVDFDEWLDFLQAEKKALDPEDKYYQTPFNQFFRKEPESIVSGLLKNLLQQRKEWKKLMDKYKEGTVEFANARASQEVIKELTNSMFGITADASSRYYSTYFSESITYGGQFWNRLSAKLLKEKLGIDVLYADTDSVFVQIDSDEEVERVHAEINRLLNEEVKRLFSLHPDVDLIDLEYEKKYEKLILLDKKRYIGRLVWSNGKAVNFIHSRGTENIKKDTIPYTKKKFIELVEMIVAGADLQTTKEWVIKIKDDVFVGEIQPEELIIVKKISKPLKDYKTKSMHVLLFEKKLNEGTMTDLKVKSKISWGERIFFVVTDKKKKEAVLASEWDRKTWDKEYYWNTHIYAPFKRVLDVVYPDFNWELLKSVKEKKLRVGKKDFCQHQLL